MHVSIAVTSHQSGRLWQIALHAPRNAPRATRHLDCYGWGRRSRDREWDRDLDRAMEAAVARRALRVEMGDKRVDNGVVV